MKQTLTCLLLGSTLLLALHSCQDAQADDNNGNSPFEYREIYLPEGIEDTRTFHLNNLNNDWGIWGHNLDVVLPARPSETIYAKQNSNTIHDQFCFSSDYLYRYIENYISDNFSATRTSRFAILPNDNSWVCLCHKCRELGNTQGNAAPAVFHMIRRLAERFPHHHFFTSWYQTTRHLPDDTLPANAGVLISAMDYPPAAVSTPQEEEFEKLLANWSRKTNKMYIWDYINNFDDYITPYPVFEMMQRRLQLYARNNVKGIFLNGSGTDYSTLSDIKTYILSTLLQNPDTLWRPLLRTYCEENYPVTGQAIRQFIIEQEDYVLQKGKPLPMYDGIDKALKTYLPEEAFNTLCDQLETLRSQTRSGEKKAVDKLADALQFTRLELMRLRGNIDNDPTEALRRLNRLNDDKIEIYNESCWTIDYYVRDYTTMYRHAEEMKDKNLLRGVKLIPRTPLDSDYDDITILTDGLLGLPSNYHCGQMISSADPVLNIVIPYQPGMKRLRVCLTRNPAYHIALPQQVQLSCRGVEIGKTIPRPDIDRAGHSFVEFELPPNLKGELLLTLVRNPEVRTMAIDEIEAY